MTKRIANMTESELVELFRSYALEQERALLHSNTKKYNRLYDQMVAINEELKARGMEARRSLLQLMDDQNLRVRYSAAVKSLAVDRERAVAALQSVVASHMMPEAAQAESALDFLNRGIFVPT